MDSLGPAAQIQQEIWRYNQLAAQNPHLRSWCNQEVIALRSLLEGVDEYLEQEARLGEPVDVAARQLRTTWLLRPPPGRVRR